MAPEDIGAAASDASKVDSLLGKIGTFSKSVAISSAENAKGLITLPGRAIDNLGSKVADLRTVISKGKGIVGDFTKSVVVSSARNAKSLLTKVKGTVSDLGTASAAFAKAFGKTYVEESGKYVNTCFSASGAAGAGADAIYKATKNGFKEAKNALQTVKGGENGFVDGAAEDVEKVKYGNQYTRLSGKKVLKPNCEYTTKEGYKYKTNSLGDIEEVEGKLKLGDGKRSLYAQRTVGGDYRLPDDDGGHLIGSQFLGSGKIDNLVPMNSQINRSGGKWYSMETEWANALKEGKDVQVKIQNIYELNNSRPVSFKIKYTIEGEKTKIIKISNKSGG
ncbi:DNA/RNA non-specific endonuclease [Clostridium felsineum]|uniref:DNA/RNA non-specific endonuclease n=2 Tax=Clostridium felsineum TaxID=36839 RepID=UPI0020346F61|nr:DNA/RNA non-specific endonuclease [Clostridium felsineum]URZ02834.1 hypothetical protein CLAUR_028680 [Clostridium felsineum]